MKAGGGCGVHVGCIDAAELWRLRDLVWLVGDGWTDSERTGAPGTRGGIAGGGPRLTEPWDWTRVGRTGAFIFGGSDVDDWRGGRTGKTGALVAGGLDA